MAAAWGRDLEAVTASQKFAGIRGLPMPPTPADYMCLYMHMYVYMYVYIYREKEREKCIYDCLHTYMYIHS